MHAKHIRKSQHITLRRRALSHLVVAATALVIASGCDNASNSLNNTASTQPLTHLPHATTNKLTVILWQSQQLQLDRAVQHANTLERSINTLTEAPTDKDLTNIQKRWQTLALSLEKISVLGALATLQSQQTIANWQAITTSYRLINTWPSELGFLDNNGTHGNRGLVFNVDIAIDEQTLTPLHNQTHHQDSIFGLYPLGLMLTGAHTQRQASQFTAIKALNKEHKTRGLSTPKEHPQNRRRQLISAQTQVLTRQLKHLKSLLQNRDGKSALNAFSQHSAQQQQLELLKAAQQLTNLQLQELAQHNALPAWQQQWQFQRLHAQITGLEQWLGLLGSSHAASLCQTLLQLLASQNNAKAQPSQNSQFSTIATSSTSTIPIPVSSIPTDHRTITQQFQAQLKQQLAGLTLSLKQAIQSSSPNPTK